MSGKYRENHSTEQLLKSDSEPVQGWECLFFHRRLKLILSVYVDDFKLVGKQASLKEGWKLIVDSGLAIVASAFQIKLDARVVVQLETIVAFGALLCAVDVTISN